MEKSLVLARLFGFVMVVLYGAILINQRYYWRLSQDIPRQPAILFLSGFITLIAGILVVEYHNIWTADWRGLITLLGWLMIIAGAVRILAPEAIVRLAQRIMESQNHTLFNVLAGVMLALGAFLLYVGFTG